MGPRSVCRWGRVPTARAPPWAGCMGRSGRVSRPGLGAAAAVGLPEFVAGVAGASPVGVVKRRSREQPCVRGAGRRAYELKEGSRPGRGWKTRCQVRSGLERRRAGYFLRQSSPPPLGRRGPCLVFARVGLSSESKARRGPGWGRGAPSWRWELRLAMADNRETEWARGARKGNEARARTGPRPWVSRGLGWCEAG